MLPFAKGKGIELVILKKEFIKNGLFDITSFFPIYFSSLYLGFLYIYIIRKNIFFKKNKITLKKSTKIVISIFLLFIATTIIPIISSYLYIPILIYILQLIVLLLVLIIPFFIYKHKNSFSDLYQIIASSTLFQSIWLIFQTLKGGYLGKDIEVHLDGISQVVSSSENSNLLRLPGTFFESSILGTFLLTNLGIILYVLIHNKLKHKNQKIVLFITAVFSIISILLTGSRAIYTLLFIILIMSYKMSNFKIKDILIRLKNDKKKYIFLMLAPLILITFFIIPYFFTRLQSIPQLFFKKGSASYRLQLTQYSLRISQKKPLFGVGLNMSPYYLATEFKGENYFVDPAHAHNLLIQLLAETGIVGTSLFILFVYFVFRPSIQSKKKFSEFHFGAMIFFLCAQFYPIFINHIEIISYFFLYLGLALLYNQKNEK